MTGKRNAALATTFLAALFSSTPATEPRQSSSSSSPLARRRRRNENAEAAVEAPSSIRLRSTLCVDSMCSADCRAYRTPLGSCYNGAALFPDDPSWGEYDVLDRADDELLEGLRPTAYGAAYGEEDGEVELEPSEEYRPYWGEGGTFSRRFYETTDGTCGGEPTDLFEDLPVGECVGPFGAPRPWGAFAFVQVKEEVKGEVGGDNVTSSPPARIEETEENGNQESADQ